MRRATAAGERFIQAGAGPEVQIQATGSGWRNRIQLTTLSSSGRMKKTYLDSR